MNCHQREQARHGAEDSHPQGGGPEAAGQSVADPVCGMWVDPATTRYRADHAGRIFYFCSVDCWSKFTADPCRYVRGQAVHGETQP